MLSEIADVRSMSVSRLGAEDVCSPGSRPYLWQPRTRAHMKEPRNTLERQAADIEDAATTANLRGC